MVKDIISLGLDSRGDITQESSTVMIIVNVVTIADITIDAVILDDTSN